MLVCSAVSGQQIYDFLLKGGRVIDPANHRDGQMDVAMVGNRIVRVAPNLPVAHARVVVDLSGYMVTPGLIDIKTHLGELKPDYNTLPYGVTTAVDVGSATCATFANFKKEVIDHAKTRCCCRVESREYAEVVSAQLESGSRLQHGATAPERRSPAAWTRKTFSCRASTWALPCPFI